MGVQATGKVADGLSAETAGDEPAAAVRGAAATDAYGGHFTSAKGIGVWGIGLEGVHGEATDEKHPGVHGIGPGVGVYGESTDATGVVGHSTHGYGVGATSTNGAGLSASSGTTPLILITNKVGVVTMGEDQGLYAWGGELGGRFGGATGIEATGSGTSGEGVHGHGSGTLAEGVLGTSDQATGVYGIASGTGANAIGVWGQTAGTYGLYTAQKVYAGGGCVGCTFAQLARNDGDGSLSVGDVVVIVGIAPPLRGHPTPRLGVRRATGGDTGPRGVVQSRVSVTTRPLPGTGAGDLVSAVDMPVAVAGTVGPGGDLLVVLEGMARVLVGSDGAPFRAGDGLVVGAEGTAAAVTPPEANIANPFAYALEPSPNGGGLVWALVRWR